MKADKEHNGQTVEEHIAPILNDYLQRSLRFRYQKLDMMRQDCDYYLTYGPGTGKYLARQSVGAHIGVMRGLWNHFDDSQKPQWLSLKQIEDYAFKMNVVKKKNTLQDAVPHDGNQMQLLRACNMLCYGKDGRVEPVCVSAITNLHGVVMAGTPARQVEASRLTAHDKDLLMTEVLKAVNQRSQEMLDAAENAVVERATDPGARAFSPEQRKVIEQAADYGGYHDSSIGRAAFYDALFNSAVSRMGDIPLTWKSDVSAELRELAKGETRDLVAGLHR